MKQIIQDLKNGETILEEVPVPQVNQDISLFGIIRNGTYACRIWQSKSYR